MEHPPLFDRVHCHVGLATIRMPENDMGTGTASLQKSTPFEPSENLRRLVRHLEPRPVKRNWLIRAEFPHPGNSGSVISSGWTPSPLSMSGCGPGPSGLWRILSKSQFASNIPLVLNQALESSSPSPSHSRPMQSPISSSSQANCGSWKGWRISGTSSSCEGELEGYYLRREGELWLEDRAKLVKPGFTQAIGEHWSRRGIEWNALTGLP